MMLLTNGNREISPDVDEKKIASKLKIFLDTDYGRMWHIVVVAGSFWMNYSHDEKYSFHFKVGKYIFLIWRTPNV
ncbi:unnamed protein product [Protopolystoma xenopodis]|uniref:Dynein light chain n=1 Tax=Protopolystoma xenopodis TaxID=117903 RepID=A0A3S5BQB1_9PLAT|nr:unnamed protein product [Protopolystoma xenopodis]